MAEKFELILALLKKVIGIMTVVSDDIMMVARDDLIIMVEILVGDLQGI